MCGIFFGIDSKNEKEEIKEIINDIYKTKERGPDNTIIKNEKYNNEEIIMGFHRLAINGLDNISDQPMILKKYKDITLMCNGEIYNYKDITKKENIKLETNSDCEIITHLYKKYDINETIKRLDGVYAFVIMDKEKEKIYYSRDNIGVRPLYYIKTKEKMYISSDMNNLIRIATENKIEIKHVLPNKYYIYDMKTKELEIKEKEFNLEKIKQKKIDEKLKEYIEKKYNENYKEKIKNNNIDLSDNEIYENFITLLLPICSNIRVLLFKAVYKRIILLDKNVKFGCLLSGGLDSSLIISIINTLLLAIKEEKIKNINDITDNLINQLCIKYYDNKGLKEKYKSPDYNCFTIGMENSTDIKYSKLVVEHLKLNHKIYNVTNTELLNNIPNTIKNITSYDITSIRASNPNFLMCKYINENYDIKVLFSGEGSDELTGGYLYLKNSPTNNDFNNECLSLLKNLYLFDVLRSDRCISNNNLEARVPFLDLDFIQYYLTIPSCLRNPKFLSCEKFLLRYSFSYLNLLPFDVLWRTKEAFSDGVSSTSNSWFNIIQSHIDNIISDNDLHYYSSLYPNLNIFSKEQVYYLNIFNSFFPNQTGILPFYWLPKWSNSLDPSARTLSIYNDSDQN